MISHDRALANASCSRHCFGLLHFWRAAWLYLSTLQSSKRQAKALALFHSKVVVLGRQALPYNWTSAWHCERPSPTSCKIMDTCLAFALHLCLRTCVCLHSLCLRPQDHIHLISFSYCSVSISISWLSCHVICVGYGQVHGQAFDRIGLTFFMLTPCGSQ